MPMFRVQCPKHRVTFLCFGVQMLFFKFNYKTNNMPAMRNNALTELKRLTEELRKSNVVSSDRNWEEELDAICFWASNDGTKSSLFEINKRIGDIQQKVRFFLSVYSHLSMLAQLVIK